MDKKVFCKKMLNFVKKFLNFLGIYLNSVTFFFNGLKSRTGMSFCFSKTIFSKFFALVSSRLLWSVNSIYSSLLVNIEFIKIQELSFLSEYFLVTALFCLTLFFLFSVKSTSDTRFLEVKFRYHNQLVFLVIYILCCYLILVYQQLCISSLSLTSFNNTIYNDQLSFVSKFVIGFTSILYLMFISKYLKNQKLNNFEYYIILLISIFGFFLLCSVNDFITAYLAIELQGLAFYVLASFKKSSNFSVESGVKYFVLGSLSTALFLIGITLIYGLCGSILFSDFKDFFIWIFSTNSAFFLKDFFSDSSEFFQEFYSIGNVSSLKKLDLIDSKLNLSDQDFDCEGFAFMFLKSGYCQFLSELSCSLKIRFLRFFEDDFLFENCHQNYVMNSLYFMKEYTLDYACIIKLKSYFSESNFYEITNLDVPYSSYAEDSLKQIFMVNYYLDCANDFLNKSFFSNVLPSNNFPYVLENSCEFWGKFVSNFYSQAYANTQGYAFSWAQAVRINYLFLEFGGDSHNILSSKFNFNLIVIGVLIVMLALFFKLALAPFHLWSPDVYEGSPSSSTFFFMVLSKFGIFVLLLRICYSSFYSLISYWQFFSLFVASMSIFVGAVAGLKQRKLKSLLTYSSINNMGFVLLAFSAGSFEGIQVNFYYLVVYMLSSVCIWSLVLNLNVKTTTTTEKQNRDLGDLTLLQESNSILAQNLGIILFSLAGLPPMVGFLAKMGVFKALSGVSIYYISVLNILFSVIATFYYLRVIKIIFFENVLIGYLYESIDSKKIFITNFLIFLLIFFFFNPMFLYLLSYKITLFLNKSFF